MTAAVGHEFDRFLYAQIGEEDNGTTLSVLSALARQDVDPWDTARALSVLPREAAVISLVALLDHQPASQMPRPTSTATAQRLVALLSSPREPVPARASAAHPAVIDVPAENVRLLVSLTLALCAVAWLLLSAHVPTNSADASVVKRTEPASRRE